MQQYLKRGCGVHLLIMDNLLKFSYFSCLSMSLYLTLHGENYNVSDVHTHLMHRFFTDLQILDQRYLKQVYKRLRDVSLTVKDTSGVMFH